MIKRNNRTILLFCLIFILSGFVSQMTGQTKLDVDLQLAQKTAKQFVKRMQETRDVTPLIKEMFHPKFIKKFVENDNSFQPKLFSQLNELEKFQFIKLLINQFYIFSINSYQPDKKKIFPPMLAEKLEKIIEGIFVESSTYKDFKLHLPKAEQIVSEAQQYLIKNQVEQSPEFQKELEDRMMNSRLDYKVEIYNMKDLATEFKDFNRFDKSKKVFYVTTPFYMSLLFIKEGNRMKIVAISSVPD